MGFLTLLEVASMPIIQLLIISGFGALLATDYFKLLDADARRSINKIVFVAFTPSLTFASLARTVTLQDIISWWFMPINIGLTVLFGAILGWIAVKLLKPKPYLEGIIIAACSSGNLGNLPLIIVPAMCSEDASPFGDKTLCVSHGLSYVSFSMALGGLYIWTFGYQMVRSSAKRLKEEEALEAIKDSNRDFDANLRSQLLENGNQDLLPITNNDPENQNNGSIKSKDAANGSYLRQVIGFFRSIVKELMAPPTVGAILGLLFGAITWLKRLIIGDNAPLRVIQDSVQLLGNGTIPCITLILGGNLTQGLKKTTVSKRMIAAIICVRYVFSPLIGIMVVKTAANLGFLPSNPLFHFVLMIQFTVPPAMNIGTIAQLFDIGEAECSVIFLWTYVAAAVALTVWSTVFMWILS